MKECVVSFGVSEGYNRPTYKRVEFEKGIDRLRNNIQDLGYDFIGWKDWPSDCPTMQFCPYGFKIYAIKEAHRQGYKHILWADSSVVFSKEGIEHCFEKIRQDGYFFLGRSNGGILCSHYTAGYFGYLLKDIEKLRGIRATYFGLSMENKEAFVFFCMMYGMAASGRTYRGKAMEKDFDLNEHWKTHGADQAVMSLLINKMGLKISPPDRHGIKIDHSYVKEKICH